MLNLYVAVNTSFTLLAPSTRDTIFININIIYTQIPRIPQIPYKYYTNYENAEANKYKSMRI